MMDRVAVHYSIGVFTNLSPDHRPPVSLQTFENYHQLEGALFRRACECGRR